MIVGSKQNTYGSTVELIESGASTRIEYKSHKQLLIELNSKAKNEMWSNEKLLNEESNIPPGGYILVHISGPTIGSANTKYWKYVVQDIEGNEIFRESGDNDIPEYTSSQYGTTWWNIDIIYLPNQMTNQFKVYVIDSLSEKRSGFIIYPDQ